MTELGDDKPHYFADDGTELNPDLIAKPSLCVSCVKDGDPSEEVPCNLTRLNQRDEPEFKCFAYEPKKTKPIPHAGFGEEL